MNEIHPRCRALCVAASLAAALWAASCSTQRWPRPMSGLKGGVAGGATGGVDEVQVLRHGDPVEVRQAGSLGSYPLRFYHKQERVRSGGLVLVGAGGRAEIVWPGIASGALLLGEAVVRIGEPSNGEPALSFDQLESARLFLTPAHSMALIGGAVLSGDPDEEQSGPFLVEKIAPDLMRVRNQSRGLGRVAYRDETFDLQPGELVDLAILGAGSSPADHDEQPRIAKLAELGGGQAVLKGQVDARAQGGAVELSATGGGGTVVVRGVEIRLDAGDRARLTGLARAPAAAPSAAAAPSSAAAPNPGATPGSSPAPSQPKDAPPVQPPAPPPPSAVPPQQP
jgi:hypothetical protein